MRFGPAVAIATLIAGFALRPALPEADGAQFLSQITWTSDDPKVGGLSALTLLDNGRAALALSDDGRLLALDVDRSSIGLAGVTVSKITDLVGDRKDKDAVSDSEGMAVGDDGAVFVSYERDHVITRYTPKDSTNTLVGTPAAFHSFGENSGLEALAMDAAGQLYTLPEKPSSKAVGFPVWRWNGAGWSQPFHLPARDGFWAVSADFGPDGAFYLLERRLTFLGFQSRLRRWDIAGDKPDNETLLLTTPAGRFGNLEGLSLWRDGDGSLRATMVSDDNFWPFMRMQLVEFVLTE